MSRSDDHTPLPRLSLDLADPRGDGAFDAWRDLVAPVFDVERLNSDSAAFSVAFEAFNLGPLAFGTSQSSAQRFVRSSSTVARSGVDHILLQLYTDGHMRGDVEGEEVDLGPGDVWLFDMSRTVSSRTTDFTTFSVVIPRRLIEPLVADIDAVHGLKLSGQGPLGALLADHLSSLKRLAPSMTLRDAQAVAEPTMQLVAACTRPALEARDAIAAGLTSHLLARLRRTIDEELANPDLGPNLLMRRHGLSRARLYRLFEPLGGVADYIRRRRLGRCFLELASPAHRDQRIFEIARRWGFDNEATFSRSFKARFGLTASDVRNGAPSAGGADGDTTMLANWMRDLMAH